MYPLKMEEYNPIFIRMFCLILILLFDELQKYHKTLYAKKKRKFWEDSALFDKYLRYLLEQTYTFLNEAALTNHHIVFLPNAPSFYLAHDLTRVYSRYKLFVCNNKDMHFLGLNICYYLSELIVSLI